MDLNMTRRQTFMNTSVPETCYIVACSENNSGDSVVFLDNKGYQCRQNTKMVYSRSNDGIFTQDDGCRLVLGLGPTPTFYGSDYQTDVNKRKHSANLFDRSSTSGADYGMLKLGLAEPVQLNHYLESPPRGLVPVVDEGSTTAKQTGGYMPSLLFAPRPEEPAGTEGRQGMQESFDLGNDAAAFPQIPNRQLHFSPSHSTDCSVTAISDPIVFGTAGDPKMQTHSPKKCMFKGCSKGARGASGFCIAHGGGQRCRKPGCNKGAESRTAYCKAHGGGRRCQQLGCTKSAEGKTDFCIAHGGGRRCGHPDCTKAARGKSGLCLRHGGGKRCNVDDCARSAEGQSGLCISHGGGRRCQHPGCSKGAQGSTMHCKAHGGGKRCIFEGCTKGAEGSTPLCKGHGGGRRCLFDGGGLCPKSVHGGTDYCVAHGGGKRCAVPDCTKSARGRTDCCVRHGGGKRCQFERCGKSAQGSTDFCKAHGGGKRCSWGMGCDKFARGKSGLCASHGSMVLSKQDCLIGPGLFHGIVPAAMNVVGKNMENESEHSSEISAISDAGESSQDLGPPHHFSVMSHPLSHPLSSGWMGGEGEGGGGDLGNGYGFMIPEGRVHGGGLMSLLGGSLKNAFDGGRI